MLTSKTMHSVSIYIYSIYSLMCPTIPNTHTSNLLPPLRFPTCLYIHHPPNDDILSGSAASSERPSCKHCKKHIFNTWNEKRETAGKIRVIRAQNIFIKIHTFGRLDHMENATRWMAACQIKVTFYYNVLWLIIIY